MAVVGGDAKDIDLVLSEEGAEGLHLFYRHGILNGNVGGDMPVEPGRFADKADPVIFHEPFKLFQMRDRQVSC